MDRVIKLASNEQCTGCGACKAICSKSAILFASNEQGFPSPIINNEKCIQCGLCEKICPALHTPTMSNIRASYAAQIKDADALKESTSGGLFTSFSREIFQQGGIVYGCVWDEEYNAILCKAENEEEIKPMQGSKYVWSWAGDTFQEIKEFLEDGRIVLFTGLPCQVAGLKNYLRKDYEKLYLVDFLCSGAPSPMALDFYLDTICDRNERKNLHLKFRDKDPYGVGVHITYSGKKKNIKKGEHIRNPYYWSFYTRLIDRESCYECGYGYGERVSDITLGDYWGISNYHHEFDVLKGVSALLINTEKGEQLLSAINNQLKISNTNSINISKANNLFIGDKTRNIKKPINRDLFFQELKLRGWKSAERKYLFTMGRSLRIVKTMLPSSLLKKIKKIK